MSGVLCATSVMGATALPPMAASVLLTNSTGTDHVTGANGNLYAFSGGADHLVSVVVTGGSGTYTSINLNIVIDGSTGGACSLVDSGDFFHHFTVAWNTMSVGAHVDYHLTLDATDDQGNTASGRWPSSGSAQIWRDS